MAKRKACLRSGAPAFELLSSLQRSSALRFVLSFQLAVSGLASGIGPLIASLVFDFTGAYRALLIGFIPAFLVSMLLIVGLGPYPDFERDNGSKRSPALA